MDSNPPLMATYKQLFANHLQPLNPNQTTTQTEECTLPLIDLDGLINENSTIVSNCKREIIAAASEWGFFQVTNHGIPHNLLLQLSELQKDVFREPFEKKRMEKLFELSPDSYCWGTPSATKLEQLSWSEAYHIPLKSTSTTRNIIGEISMALSRLAQKLASILAMKLGDSNENYLCESCTCETCYLRLNHYPPCTEPSGAFGLAPHTDSDFLTILYQDQVGGLQLMKEDSWLTVKPNPHALIINIGDLFQAWSNDMYKSVKHRVLVNSRVERFSVAYFMCPSYETVIQGYSNNCVYERFTFGEYRQQIKEDVRLKGNKIGLSRFLAH